MKLTFVPLWWFVEKEHQIVAHSCFELLRNHFLLVFCWELELFLVLVDIRQEDLHPSRSFRSEHVCLVLDASVLLSGFVLGNSFLGVGSVVVNVELSAQKVRPQLSDV